MVKRKAEKNVLENYTKTPKENIKEADYTVEFSDGEDPMKGANGNSHLGRKGRGK